MWENSKRGHNKSVLYSWTQLVQLANYQSLLLNPAEVWALCIKFGPKLNLKWQVVSFPKEFLNISYIWHIRFQGLWYNNCLFTARLSI